MYAITNSTIYTGTGLEYRKAILIDENSIIDIINEKDLPSDIRTFNLNGLNLAPGFIDLQVYGGDAILFSTNASKQGLYRIAESFQKVGTTSFLITIPTSSPETISKCIKATREYLDEGGPGLIGLHLEGPFINAEKKGAHIERFIQPLTIKHLKKLVDESAGAVKMITVAPEQCTEECVEFLHENNIIVSVGHSNATYDQANGVFNMGVKVATHLFNAMSGFNHREPGLVGAIYDSESVYSSIIPDGVHTDFASVRISKKIMKDRLFIITDAVVENLKGDYVYKAETDRFVDVNGTLAGSALTMMKAVKNCIEKAGIDVEEALRMASTGPAKVINLDHYLGKVAPGYAADFVVFDDNYNVHYTIANGEIITND
ncbi:N-acetylglucosamine-6-phosphate deacetylase [Solitalea lacus]|uniref:N-acetylglucosamine-6-phosphate deacetylase n=1 Tax=Solitalea lacus TaxID=2911172 RepID=UPI001EDA9EDF|nr:N-acetylglucosamine-6-phosphate deacetylase [Solitalea lacus]UKJ06276.1 N-acetylglucosamine-6-phosphate deacetylase [Solitalea lacus]